MNVVKLVQMQVSPILQNIEPFEDLVGNADLEKENPLDQSSRIDYQKVFLPEELKEMVFSKDYVNGEKYYWEGGLRQKLLKERKGDYVATNGNEVPQLELYK